MTSRVVISRQDMGRDLEARRYLAGFRDAGSFLLGDFDLLEEMCLDILDRFGKGIAELLKVLFVEENLMLLVLIFTDSLTFRDRDIEILLGLCRLHIKEVRAFSCPHTLREDLIFVAIVVQGLRPPCKKM